MEIEVAPNTALDEAFSSHAIYAQGEPYWELFRAGLELVCDAHAFPHATASAGPWAMRLLADLSGSREISGADVAEMLRAQADDDQGAEGPLLRRYRAEQEEMLAATVGPHEVMPHDDAQQVLATAEALLLKYLPAVVGTCLPFVRSVRVLSDRRRQLFSLSEVNNPGFVFLGQVVEDSPDLAAEALLHEALHQKLYALSRVIGFHTDKAPSGVCKPYWKGSSDRHEGGWDAFTVLAAFHVYAHIAALWASGGRDPSIASEARTWRRERSLTALLRARHLEGWLRGGVLTDLSPAAVGFVEWISEGLAAAEPLTLNW